MAIDGNVLDSFFVALGFKVDPEGIEKFQKDFEGLRSMALKVGTVLTAAAAGVGLFVEHVAKGLGDMQHFAEVNHLSAAELQAFNAIARENHIDVDAMDQGIAELNKRLGQAQLGTGRLLPILKKLGIGLKDTHGHARDVNSILGAVADKMKKLTPSENLGLGARLGLDPGMILLLQKGSENWRKVFAEAQKNVSFSQEDLDRAEQTDRLFVKSRHNLEVIGDLIALRVMPVVDKLLDRFIAWYKVASADPNSILNRSLDVLARSVEVVANDLLWLLETMSSVGAWLNQYALPSWVTTALPQLAHLVIPALIAGFIALGIYGVSSLVAWGASVAATCGSAITWFLGLAGAEAIAFWPITLAILAVAALAAGAYLVYKNWHSIIGWFGSAWDWVIDKIVKVIEFTEQAWGKVRHFFGGSDTQVSTILRESEAARGQAPSWAASRGDAWVQHSSSRASTIIHSNHIAQLTVVSPDPAKAGEAVRQELGPSKNRRMIRNSQGFAF